MPRTSSYPSVVLSPVLDKSSPHGLTDSDSTAPSIYDATFLITFIAIISLASVFSQARPPQKGKNLSRKYFLYYDLAQLVTNGFVCVRLILGLDKDVFGFSTEDSKFIRRTVEIHYYAKYLDLLFTALLIVSHKWEKLGICHRFHHVTIGPVWFYVLQTDHKSGAYAFGALVSSFVHFFLYLHFFLRSMKMRPSAWFRTLLGYLQLGQCVLCFGHAIWALVFETGSVDGKLSVLQLLYVCNAFVLYYRDLMMGVREKFGRTRAEDEEVVVPSLPTEKFRDEVEKLQDDLSDAELSPSDRGFSSGALKAFSSPTKRRSSKSNTSNLEFFPDGPPPPSENDKDTESTDENTSPSSPLTSSSSILSSTDLIKRGFAPILHTRIHDAVYDLTQFQVRHPGGNIISQYHEVDATDAYEAFHGDSEWAKKTLRSLPKIIGGVDGKEADENTKEHSKIVPVNPENMAIFHQDLQKRYYNQTRHLIFFGLWFLGTVSMICFSLWLAKHCQRPLLGGVIIGVAWAHCGFLQHHAGHVAVTGRRSIDFLIQTFVEGLLKGGSARWWRGRHNKHHAMPNRIGVDGDLHTTPFFAWDSKLAKKCYEWSLKIQEYTFIPFLALYVPVFFYTTKKSMVKKHHWDEIGVVMLHWYFALNYFKGEWMSTMLLFYSVGYAIQGVYLGFFFGLNHFAEDRVEDKHISWARCQVLSELN